MFSFSIAMEVIVCTLRHFYALSKLNHCALLDQCLFSHIHTCIRAILNCYYYQGGSALCKWSGWSLTTFVTTKYCVDKIYIVYHCLLPNRASDFMFLNNCNLHGMGLTCYTAVLLFIVFARYRTITSGLTSFTMSNTPLTATNY